MTQSSSTGAIRILSNNKVYRQLFDAQVQLSDTYNRVRTNQLSQSVNVISRSDGIPLVRNIRPHESQKRQWLTSMSYSNDSSINPIAILFRDEHIRRETEQKQELDELKREVFNLPDTVDYVEIERDENEEDGVVKGNVTERLASKRGTKFTQLWNELLEKISSTNQNLISDLEKLTRECNTYYEQGEKEINEYLRVFIYKKEITSLTVKSFEHAFKQLNQCLAPRLSQIQEYCQSIGELETERIQKIRDLFKSYSEHLYKTHHLSDQETASRLEKQVNELNKEILDNRRIYAELEARLLTGETLRVHRFQAELVDYQNKWRDATWIIHKQTWISKLSQCRAKLEPNILSTCQPMGAFITEQTHAFIEHVNTLNAFIPPASTRDNAQKWYQEGFQIVDTIVKSRNELVQKIEAIIKAETELLKKEHEQIREKVREAEVYNDEQTRLVLERDIEPLLEERKRFLQESVVDRIQATSEQLLTNVDLDSRVVYERSTAAMYNILKRLLTFIQPASEQWDSHQTQLENVTTQLLEMMREFRRPFDLQNEKKLTKLDSTLDEMRSASNETALSRLLNSAYEQLDIIKASYAQFYDTEHSIVNKYPDMIAQEVDRYKNEMLMYFRARQVSEPNANDQQYHTTTLARKTYELDDFTKNLSEVSSKRSVSTTEKGESKTTSRTKSRSEVQSRLASIPDEEKQPVVQTFLTEDLATITDTDDIPFYEAFQIPSNLVQSIVFHLRRAFLDYYDQWKEETVQRTEAVIHSKHEELEKEMDFQMHLHEPRRIRIETDIHNVRTAELVMHEERVERHLRGVQETLEQTDSDYARMLNDFAKSLNTYRENIVGLEEVFVNATTSGRLGALHDRLTKQREVFMDQIRNTLRSFRKRFDDVMQYLRQANVKFRKSFKTFTEGGNFSRDEIEVHRKKLEKTIYQIDKAESAILKELEKLEKKQLEEATKIMSQFQERFKNHMIDLQFIELTNRWISETQVKIKSEVALNNQQAHALKILTTLYQTKLDAIENPNLDKQTSTLSEVREVFQQIVLATYERALYLKCLTNELGIPASLLSKLKQKGLITEEQLINDLNTPGVDDATPSRRPSRNSAGHASNSDEAKSVKFGATSSLTLGSVSRPKGEAPTLMGLNVGHPEETNTISTIKTLLHKHEQAASDEVMDNGLTAPTDPHVQSMVSDTSSHSTRSKKSKQQEKKVLPTPASTGNETMPSSRTDPPIRVRTRDEIYELYCTFGEKKHLGEDFLSRMMNIFRSSTEGLLSHAELYYKEKGFRPVTRPQALREKFEEYARSVIEKLKNYEQQCRSHHEQSVHEFRDILEFFERVSSSIGKIELQELMLDAEKNLTERKRQFDIDLNETLDQSNDEKTRNYEHLRPTFGQPARKHDLEQIDAREKRRQEDISKKIHNLRTDAIEDLQTNAQSTVNSFATSAELLLILFDEILTADEIKRTKLPPVRQSLIELIRRQQAGRPLEDSDPPPLIERKQGHWPGLPLTDDPRNSRRESNTSKKRASVSSQRHKVSAAIVTQKTTLPQLETITHRDHAYQKYKELLGEVLAQIDEQCSVVAHELDRHRSYWNASIEKLQQLRTS